jgi:hypothetical protein
LRLRVFGFSLSKQKVRGVERTVALQHQMLMMRAPQIDRRAQNAAHLNQAVRAGYVECRRPLPLRMRKQR